MTNEIDTLDDMPIQMFERRYLMRDKRLRTTAARSLPTILV
ncbi:MAG: hypothetical protein AB4352_20785 [Hormoscilla sp.]